MRLHKQKRHLQQVTFIQRRSVDPLARFVLVSPLRHDDRIRIAFVAFFGEHAHAERPVPQFEEWLTGVL